MTSILFTDDKVEGTSRKIQLAQSRRSCVCAHACVCVFVFVYVCAHNVLRYNVLAPFVSQLKKRHRLKVNAKL